MFCKKRIIIIGIVGMMIVTPQLFQHKLDSKIIVTGYASWQFYTFEDAVKDAETIVYGRVADKSGTLSHKTIRIRRFCTGRIL